MPLPNARADHVGSLLRPEPLRRAHREHAQGAISDEQLRKVTEAAIADAVASQEESGLEIVTDGEFRRGSWFLGFVEAVEGIDLRKVALDFEGQDTSKHSWLGPVITGRLSRKQPIIVDDYRFLATRSARIAKVTLPTPSAMHFFGGPNAVSKDAYPDDAEFFADLTAIYRAELGALHAAGCRYVQLDEVPLALLCDSRIREGIASRGDDPERLTRRYIDALNAAIAGRPDDLTIGMHLCRGNYKGNWMGSGGYDPIAERLFNELDVDAYLLEFDSERAGSFAPLRFLPAGKRVYLGIVSTKTGELERMDELRRRLDEAFRYVSPDAAGVCPQCGFASSAGGNPITSDVQWAKLRHCVALAQLTWGAS